METIQNDAQRIEKDVEAYTLAEEQKKNMRLQKNRQHME